MRHHRSELGCEPAGPPLLERRFAILESGLCEDRLLPDRDGSSATVMVVARWADCGRRLRASGDSGLAAEPLRVRDDDEVELLEVAEGRIGVESGRAVFVASRTGAGLAKEGEVSSEVAVVAAVSEAASVVFVESDESVD
jgi:hypothetical protein